MCNELHNAIHKTFPTVISSSPANSAQSVIPFLTVSVTADLNKNASLNSNIAAITVACFNVIARAQTDVANAFATSFAAILHAIAQHTNTENTNNHSQSFISTETSPNDININIVVEDIVI